MGDHSESIQVQFDSQVILYRELLEIFWREHHPLQPASSRQYRSAVFYHTPDQERLARQVKAEQEANRGHTLYTALEPAGHFFPAEDYHQKYYLQRRKELMALLEKYILTGPRYIAPFCLLA
jgi:methionine-S-sulfoxide reductase